MLLWLAVEIARSGSLASTVSLAYLFKGPACREPLEKKQKQSTNSWNRAASAVKPSSFNRIYYNTGPEKQVKNSLQIGKTAHTLRHTHTQMGLVCSRTLAGRKSRVAGSEEGETCMWGEESYWGMTPVFRNVLLADDTAVFSRSERGCYQRVDLSVSTITLWKAWGV